MNDSESFNVGRVIRMIQQGGFKWKEPVVFLPTFRAFICSSSRLDYIFQTCSKQWQLPVKPTTKRDTPDDINDGFSVVSSTRRKKVRTSTKSYITSKTCKIDTQPSNVSLSNQSKNYFDVIANNETEKMVITVALKIQTRHIQTTWQTHR